MQTVFTGENIQFSYNKKETSTKTIILIGWGSSDLRLTWSQWGREIYFNQSYAWAG